MSSYPYALQLYSVRDCLEGNPEEGLRLVAESGYQYVELAGDYDLSALKLTDVLHKSGLVPVSMHIGYDEIIGQPEDVIRKAHILQTAYVVVPWLGSEVCPGRDDWLEAAESMDDAGQVLGREGVQLCYHNHDHEFTCIGDETIFDIIYGNSDPENLKMELDLCWAVAGKADVPDLLERYSGRVPLVHVKDFKSPDDGASVVFTELGEGIMEWDALMPAALEAGAKWFIVEQDTSEIGSMKSAAKNAAFMGHWNK